MPRRPKTERVLSALIDQTFRGYFLAAKTRVFYMEMCDMAFRINDPEDTPKVPVFIRQAALLTRMCDGMSNELQKLHELQDRILPASDKSLRVVIEHVESPWRPETDAARNGSPNHPRPPDGGQNTPDR